MKVYNRVENSLNCQSEVEVFEVKMIIMGLELIETIDLVFE